MYFYRTLSTTIDHVYIYRENLFIFKGRCQLPLIMYLFIERICLFLQDFVNNLFIFTGLCQLPLIMYLFIERICLFLQDFVRYH